MPFFQSTFLYPRLQHNPSYYYPSHFKTIEEPEDYLIQYTKEFILNELQENHCIEWNKKSDDLKCTILGKLIFKSKLHHQTIHELLSSLKQGSQSVELIELIFICCNTKDYQTYQLSIKEEANYHLLYQNLQQQLHSKESILLKQLKQSKSCLMILSFYFVQTNEKVHLLEFQRTTSYQNQLKEMIHIFQKQIQILIEFYSIKKQAFFKYHMIENLLHLNQIYQLSNDQHIIPELQVHRITKHPESMKIDINLQLIVPSDSKHQTRFQIYIILELKNDILAFQKLQFTKPSTSEKTITLTYSLTKQQNEIVTQHQSIKLQILSDEFQNINQTKDIN